MDSIEEYITKLKSTLRDLKADQSLADEYSLHVQAEFTDFKTKKSQNIETTQLEKVFVAQLEDPKIIARSLAGIESGTELGISSNIKSLAVILQDTSKLAWQNIKEGFSRLKIYYRSHESPLFIATTLLAICIGINILMNLLFSVLILPISLITPYGENSSVYIGNWENLSSSNQGLITILPLGQIITLLTLELIIISIIIFLGWKYGLIYTLKTVIYFTLFITPIYSSLNIGEILNIILLNRNATTSKITLSLTPDWITAQLPNVNSFIPIFINEAIYTIFLYFFVWLSFFMLIGYFLKLVKTNIRSLDKVKIRPLPIFALVILLFIILYIFTFPLIDVFPTTTQATYIAPPTPFQSPLVYQFGLESPTVPRDYSGIINYQNISIVGIGPTMTVVVPQGKTEYYINITAFTFTTNTIVSQGCYLYLNPPHIVAGQDIFKNVGSCLNTSAPINNLLGILYAPVNNFSQYSHLFNGSYPFTGYEPSINTTQQILTWNAYYDSQSSVNLPVFTLEYRSTINNSVFTFQFDRNTGWLMNATLELDNGSWVPGLNFNVLSISRLFVFQTTNNQSYFNKFYNTFNILMASVILINWVLLLL